MSSNSIEDPGKTFEENLELIYDVIQFVCRKSQLYGEDAEDFQSETLVKLMAEDYLVLRKFQGKSSLKTYLNTVIHRIFQDYRNKRWGKWRNSAEAKRQGEVAMRLERLIVRDGRNFKEAVQSMRLNEGCALSEAELYHIAEKLPPRSVKAHTGEDALKHLPNEEINPDSLMILNEASAFHQRFERVLRQALQTLNEEERLLVKFSYFHNLSIAEIARAGVNRDAKKLYRNREKALRKLKSFLIREGIREEDAKAIFRNIEAES